MGIVSTVASICLLLTAADADQGPPRGRLVAMGGGTVRPEDYRKIVELRGGGDVRVVVMPYAARIRFDPEVLAKPWRMAGATEVTVLDPDKPEEALGPIREADVIWIGGGDQVTMMRRLEGAPIAEAIRERFRAGAIVAGTSAGASALSGVMIAGTDRSGPGGRRTARIGAGLGLWPEAIVDQHFTVRNRFERLKGAVLGHPDLVGIGIDEQTAVVVSGDGRRFEILGKGSVVVIDARRARPGIAKPVAEGGADPTARAEVTTHVLKAGMAFDLDDDVGSEVATSLGH